MPSRYLSAEAPQSGLDAFLTGAGQAYTGIRDERRKRQVEAQQDALLKQQMQNAEYEQQRKNIEAGVSIQQGVRPDPIQQGQAQATGVRAKIGSILRGVFGGGQSSELQPTPTLVKTGPSQQERVAQIGEEGANSRNAATITGENARNAASIASMDSRSAADLAELTRYHDLEHSDRLAAIAAQRDAQGRLDRREDARDLRDYGTQIRNEIADLQRRIADKNGIMQEVGGADNPTTAYQLRQREMRNRLAELYRQADEVKGAMNRKAIGSKLGRPAAPAAPAGVPSRTRTPEEDMLLRAMPPGSL